MRMSQFSPRLLPDRADLSAPRGSARGMAGRYDADFFGRMSEGIARTMGTGRFLAGQTIFVDGGLTLYADFRDPWSSE